MDLKAPLLAHLEFLQPAGDLGRAAINQQTPVEVVDPVVVVAVSVPEVLDRAVLVILLLHPHRKETTAAREVRVQITVIELVAAEAELAQVVELVQILPGVTEGVEDLFLKLE
jgi:hypothetical protein